MTMTRYSAVALAAALAFLSVSAPAIAMDGAKVFKKCKACHTLTGKNRVGPSLKGVIGRKCGAVTSYKYGKSYKEACKTRPFVIDAAFLETYLQNPSKKLTSILGKKSRSKMNFKLSKAGQRASVIHFLTEQK